MDRLFHEHGPSGNPNVATMACLTANPWRRAFPAGQLPK